MGVGNPPDSSIVGSQASLSPTDLSKKTDRTSYSIPDDGRPVTIPTRRKKKDVEVSSNLSHGTNTSLLIEYFESGKHNSSGSSRRPSVRVKVTPSAAKRHNIKSTADGVQISDVGTRSSSRQGRKPSHTHRISLSPNVVTEDRLILGEPSPSGRPRSHSGEFSTLSSYTSADDSNVGHHYPLNVTVIREAGSPSSLHSSPRDLDGMDHSYQSRRSARQNRSNLKTDPLLDKEGVKTTKGRSRSVSRESDRATEEGGLKAPKLSRRRSRSLSRDRVSMSQKEKDAIQQGVMEGLERLRIPKASKSRSRSGSRSNGDGLKTPRRSSPGRTREEEDSIAAEKRRARNASYNQGSKAGSNITNNPAVLEAIEDAIKRLILPQLNELKTNQNLSRLEQSLNSPPPPGIDRSNSRRMEKCSSMPDVKRPKVVLTPDHGNGQGMVIAGGPADHLQEVSPLKIRRDRVKGSDGGLADNMSEKSDSSFARAPVLGPIRSPIHSEADGEGVSLMGAVPVGGHLEMPDVPGRLDTPGETRGSIPTAQSGFPPYPATARESGMPLSGTTPPPDAPKSEFPQFSELDFNLNVPSRLGKSRQSSAASLRSARNSNSNNNNNQDGRSTVSRGGPSIVSFAPIGDLDVEDVASGVSSRSGHSNAAPTTIQPGASEISIRSMSSTQSTKLARRRRKGKAKEEDMSDINEGEQSLGEEANGSSQKGNAVDWYFANMREKAQERALLDPTLRSETIEARHVQTHTENAFEDSHLDKLAAGPQVFAVGATPSMRSTPVAANSAVASVLNPSNVDGVSNISFNEPQLGSSALPSTDYPLPDINHITNIAEEDEEINTNPSIIQGPIGHQPDDWKFDPPAQAANDLRLNGDRGMDPGDNTGGVTPLDPGADRTPQLKDEGYMSAANPGMMSPGSISPSRGMRDPSMGMGLDDLMSEGDYSPYQRGHVRMGSGNSHGMPSPLYDSATGRGIDRIQSKDIVALMDHLTVRDAQRNARDTEILVTLVRSAAEMRNSFEDMKKALQMQTQQIVGEVDQNTERSIQKVIQGPRPLPPSAPRVPRYITKADDDGEEDGPAKRSSIFKRALKGLSGRSSSDLQRIEEMLMTLLSEVEGLKGGQEFYQQTLLQSQSLGNVENHLKSMIDAAGTQNTNSSAGNSGYYSGNPSSQPSNSRLYQDDPLRQSTRISPIAEDSAPPSQSREVGGSLPLDSSPPTRAAPAAPFSSDNTPSKSEKRGNRESGSSIFPKISRWSETTASSGMRGILGRKKRPEDISDASQSQQDFWEAEAKANRQAEQFPGGANAYPEPLRTERAPSPLLPPSSRDADSPLNESNRISLDILQPQPRLPPQRQMMEAQAQQLSAEGIFPQSPNFNQSTGSLASFPPIAPGGYQNGKLLSPLAQDAYLQHQAQQNAALSPPLPPAKDDSLFEPESPGRSERSRKHKSREDGDRPRKHKKERTEEEKQRRRERKERKERERLEGGTSKKRSRDGLSTEESTPAFSGRTPSTASRLNGPRPLSEGSNKENSRRQRHHGSYTTNGED
ncbi:hypothetical protein RUND412_006173 [Rhizina undulata]